MADQKNTLLAIVLSVIVLVGWQYFVASSTLSPWLGDHLEDCDLSDLAVTGFINVQVGRPNGGDLFGLAAGSWHCVNN